MRRREADSAFILVKAYIERCIPDLKIICGASGRVGIKFSCYCFWYRSKADFVGMMLGFEIKAAADFRQDFGSPKIRPIASSIEELRLKYESKYGGFWK